MSDERATLDLVTPQAAQEIAVYSTRYSSFLDEIRSDLDELRATGVMSRARDLSLATGQHFADNTYPAYFFGDLNASFVLVHLNPQYSDTPARRMDGDEAPCSFEEHFERHRHFGAQRYGPASSRTHRSRFDYKQISFLQAFDVIDFREDDKFTNLERVIDHKLQLELIPYGSASFSSSGFTSQILSPHFARIMGVISAVPRDYVIFCGEVFGKLLKPEWVVEDVDERKFRLTKNDGSMTKQASSFANLRLPCNGGTIHAGWAQSWARQGIPMRSYGQEVQRRYRRYENRTTVPLNAPER
jgi:hypothetical protein